MNSNASLKDFEIIAEIGKGAFGYVFKVKRLKDGHIYALKKVCMNKLKQKEKENSLNEIRILASISHMNVISYKEAFYDALSNCICIVMEFADCGDLEKKITDNVKKKTYMTESEIISYFIQIVQGLKALHDRKILHRDIKAANIFLFEGDLVKIGDLNLSKVIKMGMLHTQTGTPYYASPEVWNDKPYDYKSDIWSLGCLLYEMTTLKAPFRGTTMKGVYEKVMKGVYDPIPNFYSKTLNNIINSMLQINFQNRPNCEHITNIIVDKMKNLKLAVNIFSFQNPAPPLSEDIKPQKDKLLKTIKIPKKMNELNLILPKCKYKKRDLSIINEDRINKTEIIEKDNYSTDNIKDISAIYQNKNDKLIHELFYDKDLKSRNDVRPYSVNPNINNDDGKCKLLERSILIPDINIIKNENVIDVINKPILIKRNVSLKKNKCLLNNLVPLIDLDITPTHMNEINKSKEKSSLIKSNLRVQKNILNLKNIHDNSIRLDQSSIVENKTKMNVYNTEEKEIDKSTVNITPIIKKDRPISMIGAYKFQISRRDKNNSSNMRRILNQDSTISPKYNDKSALLIGNDNKLLLDNSYLPNIQKKAEKINLQGLNLFNQKNINFNNSMAIKILNPDNKNKQSPIRHNLYPVNIEKDQYNYEIKNYNINADIIDAAFKNNKPAFHKIHPKIAYHNHYTNSNNNSNNISNITTNYNSNPNKIIRLVKDQK